MSSSGKRQKTNCCRNVFQEAIAATSYLQPIKTLKNGNLEEGFSQAAHVVEGEVGVIH